MTETKSNPTILNRGHRITEDTFIKTGPAPQIAIEAEKTSRARVIGSQSGFIVPRVLEQNDGCLTLERLKDLSAIAKFRGTRPSVVEVHKQVGRSIRAVHEKMTLDANVPLPAALRGPDEVFLHGDLSTENVCVQNGSVVILDWQMTSMHGGAATFGSRYFDVAWFINNLFSRPSLNIFQADFRARAFLDGYFEMDAAGCSRLRFYEYHKKFRRYKLDLRKSNPLARRLVMAPGHFLWRRFDSEKE